MLMHDDYDNGVVVDRSTETIESYQDLLASIQLYINWKYVTKQLTSKQKELFAKSIEASVKRAGDDPFVDRWWI